MAANTGNPAYKDQTRWLVIIGALLLLAGIAIGFLGPLEMYCFYLFVEGGRFHYAGFGFGSFMFGNIASQIVGYYLLAALFIPLGYGHLTKRRWARRLTLAWLWAWLVVGAPLVVIVFFILLASKDLSIPAALLALVLLLLSYLVVPGALIRFYQGNNVRQTFAAKDAGPGWLEAVPLPNLVLSSLYLFYVVMLHLLILFHGIFPVFGVFLFGMPGIMLLDLCIGCLLGLTWGTLQRQAWAWWGAVIWLGLFTCSTILTFCQTDYPTLLAGLAFPPREIEFLGGIPVQGYHLAILTGIPLLITWGVAVLSKRHFV